MKRIFGQHSPQTEPGSATRFWQPKQCGGNNVSRIALAEICAGSVEKSHCPVHGGNEPAGFYIAMEID